ncbi:restriction endonuclease [bacterium BMS3Abin14]|nr:restriction endonuclease [bacterium BMS3Abin14]
MWHGVKLKNMDDLYCDVFGSKPRKRGTGYELLVACVLKHLNRDAETTHNVFMKSFYSKDKYQIDALLEDDNSIFVESKDYSEHGQKVGRSDICKLSGALVLLKDVDGGIVASSTDFTRPAQR